MDIFQFALEKEKYSEQFYRDLANRTNYVGLRNIFTMLADEEVKHYHVVQHMEAETPHEISETPILNTPGRSSRNRGSSRRFDFNITEADLYRKACDIEEESERFYLQRAEEVEDPAQKEIFRKLAAEEHKHWIIVDNIRSFVAQPETFLENAEMFHQDDYVEGVF